MNVFRKVSVGLIVALSIVGCSSEDIVYLDGAYPIQPTSRVVSRVVLNAGSAFDASLFRVDQELSNDVFAYPTDYSSITSALPVSVASDGKISFTDGDQYYLDSDAKTALLGVYPAVGNGGTWNNTAATVTYAIDGKTDIVATSFAEGDKSSVQPSLTFGHVLTQFVVKVYKDGDEDVTVKSIKVVGRAPVATLTLPAPGAAGAVTSAFSGDATDLSFYGVGSEAVASELAVTATTAQAAQTFGYSIFAPVTEAAAITLKVDLGGDIRDAIVPSAIFEKGKRYTVLLTLPATSVEPPAPIKVKIEGVSSVDNWVDNVSEIVGDLVEEKVYGDPSNSYVLASGKTIYIPVSRANDYTDYLRDLAADEDKGSIVDAIGAGDDFTAGFLWADAPLLLAELDIEGSGKTGYIKVTANSNAVEGNAVVAVKVGDVIKWSWHIWVTDYEPKGTWLDRHLGALSATPGDQQKTYGLFYQWGRKDPFPAAGVFSANTEGKIYTAIDDNTGTAYSVATGRVTTAQAYSYSITNPTSFIGVAGSWFTGSTTTDNQWGATGGKTIFDPCPKGYRVPAFSGTTSPWNGLTTSTFAWDGTNKGRASAAHGGWYGAAGYRNNATGALASVGAFGYAWSASASTAANGSFLYFGSSYVDPSNSNLRAYGLGVRCLLEQ